MFTQSYSVIPKNLKRHGEAIFVWYTKEIADLKMIHDENNMLTDDQLVIVMVLLKSSKYTSFHIRNEHSRGFMVLNHASKKMNKIPKQVTKNPKRQEAARKSKEICTNKLKESILNEATNNSNASNDATNTTTSSTTSDTSATTGSSDTYSCCSCSCSCVVAGHGCLCIFCLNPNGTTYKTTKTTQHALDMIVKTPYS